MPHLHRPPLNLRSAHAAWVDALARGEENDFREGIASLSADDRFLLGLSCATRDLHRGLSLLLDVIPPEDVQSMGIHWLEAAIFHEAYAAADVVRGAGVDPFADHGIRRSFEGGGVFQRRNSWASQWLENLDDWDEAFIGQWQQSRLPDLFLHRAIHHNGPETVAFVVDHGAPLNTTHEAHLPIWAALRAGKPPVLQFLIDRGASIQMAGEMANKSPVVFAAERGLGKCVWTLVAAGASLVDRCTLGLDASTCARAAGHALLASEIEAHAMERLPQASGHATPRRL